MFSFSQLLVISLVAMLLLKPAELRKMSRTMGQWMREIRRMSQEFTRELTREADLEDLREEVRKIEKELDLGLGDDPLEDIPAYRDSPGSFDDESRSGDSAASDEDPSESCTLGEEIIERPTAEAEESAAPDDDHEPGPEAAPLRADRLP